MKKLIAVIFILCMYSGFSQIQLSGKVQQENNEVIVGAHIQIVDQNLNALSDTDGNYLFNNLSQGEYLFEVSFIGYKTLVVKTILSKDTIVDFRLFTSVNELSEIVVTGVSRSTEIKETPIVIKTLDKKYFVQTTSSNIIDGLSNVPGINNISSGPAISKPVIRGLGYNRVITLNNGIRQEGQQWGDEHGIEIDEYSIERVEIIKGPGSLMYGSDGIAGVLNFLAPKSPNEGKIKTQLISNYQTNNHLIANSLSNSGNIKGVQWLGRITHKNAGNYRNSYDGYVYNSGFQELDGNLFLGISKKWGHSYLRISSWNNTLNLPEGERDSLGNFIFVTSEGLEKSASKEDLEGYKIGYPHQKINQNSVTWNNFILTKKGTINLDLGYQNNRRREFGNPTSPNVSDLFFDLNSVNYNLRYNLQSIKGWESSIGATGMFQTNQNKGLEFLIPAYSLFDIGGFVTIQKKIRNNLNFAGGFRFDNRSIHSNALYLDSLGEPAVENEVDSYQKFSSIQSNYNGFSCAIGISYLMNKYNTLKINLSQGYRAPTISEIASNGRHEGAFRYEIGNKRLKSEQSTQLDVAYFHNSDHFVIELSPYINSISNYIYLEKLNSITGGDSIFDPTDPAPVYQFSQGNALLFGGELFTDLHPHPLDWLHIENSFSIVRAYQLNVPDSSKNLPFIPAPKYKGELKGEFNTVGKMLNESYVKFGVTSYFEQNFVHTANGSETKTPAYTILNASLGTNIKIKEKADFIQLVLNVENITNNAYQNHLSRLKYAPENPLNGRMGIFNMGRNISLKAIINL